MFNRRIFLCSCAFFVTSFLVEPAAQGQQPAIQQPFKADGKIHSLVPARNVIRMVTAANQPWELVVDESTAVQVTGEGGAKALAPGLWVRFFADLDKKGVGHGDVMVLTIFDPAEEFGPAAAVESDVDGEKPHVGNNSDAEKDSDNALGDEAANQKEEPEVKTQRYLVSGQIRRLSFTGRLTVIAGTAGTIRCQIAKDAVVKIDTASLAALRPGADISAEGTYEKEGAAKVTRIRARLGDLTALQAAPRGAVFTQPKIAAHPAEKPTVQGYNMSRGCARAWGFKMVFPLQQIVPGQEPVVPNQPIAPANSR